MSCARLSEGEFRVAYPAVKWAPFGQSCLGPCGYIRFTSFLKWCGCIPCHSRECALMQIRPESDVEDGAAVAILPEAVGDFINTKTSVPHVHTCQIGTGIWTKLWKTVSTICVGKTWISRCASPAASVEGYAMYDCSTINRGITAFSTCICVLPAFKHKT